MNELVNRSNATGMVATQETAEIAEIQGKMILARQFPRDFDTVRREIAAECTSKKLAETAVYEFPRGDSVVRGASIRLVECVARHFGNILCGVKEIATSGNRATVKAYCWDLETNFADEKIFDVEYVRHTKSGSYPLTDPRDRYEMLANQGARRKRACMQAIIPQFIIDEAIDLCQETLQKNTAKDGSIEDVRAKTLTAFAAVADWITPDMLAKVCGKDDFNNLMARDIVKLRNLYNAIKDGFVKPENAFGKEEAARPSDADADKLASVNDMLGNMAGGQK